MLIGLAIGIILGFSSALLIFSFKKMNRLSKIWIDFLRSIPAPALVPLALLLFGIGDISKISLVAFIVSLIILVNSLYGIHNANPTRIITAKTMGLNKLDTFLKVIVPDSVPHISSGIRMSISFSLIVVIVSEIVMGAEFGMGQKIIDYQLVYQISNMYAAIIAVGLLGYVTNKLYLNFEKKYIHWAGK